MLNMMIGTSRQLRRVNMLRQVQTRPFSALVTADYGNKSVAAKSLIKEEFWTFPIDNAKHNELQQEYAEFNESCDKEMQMMNKNIIDAIIERSGDAGWVIKDKTLQKSFTFDSFEQCQFFCTEVSRFANKTDHHPEWALTDQGRTINVTLCSHFAANTVTRADFILAEEMNKQHAYTVKRFRPYPRFESG